jgi:hypothetical protein
MSKIAEWLNKYIQEPEGALYSKYRHFSWVVGHPKIIMRGAFTADELIDIAQYMKTRKAVYPIDCLCPSHFIRTGKHSLGCPGHGGPKPPEDK